MAGQRIHEFLESLGLRLVDTGGGVMAYRGERPGGGHVLVTASDDAAPPRDGADARVGHYDRDGVLLGETRVRADDHGFLEVALGARAGGETCPGCGHSRALCICQRADD